MPRGAALPGGSNGGLAPLRKLSHDDGPKASSQGVSRESDREQLAVLTENPNHHTGNESKAESDRKVFLALRLNIWIRPRNDLARGRTLLRRTFRPSSWAVGTITGLKNAGGRGKTFPSSE